MQSKVNIGRFGQKGQAGIESIISVIVFLIGFYIFLVLFDPLVGILFPALSNAEVYPNAAVIKLVILIIPVVLALMGIIIAVNSLTGKGPPPSQVYYQ